MHKASSPPYIWAVVLLLLTGPVARAQWNLAESNTKESLRGIHDVGKGVIWASGAHGTVRRSEDDGFLWQSCSVPPGAADLDFRAVFGWDADHALVMSGGMGAASRLYETTDGCTSWHLIFENPDSAGFWDALALSGKESVILGDPVGGHFALFSSHDSGRHWRRMEGPKVAASSGGEGAFAASNSSLLLRFKSELLFGTGGVGGPRIFLFRSRKWLFAKLPLAAGKASTGMFSVALSGPANGVAVGGDYLNASQTDGTAAWTSDGGLTWRAASSMPSGYRSSVGWEESLRAWIAVGPNGSDLSVDDGHTWHRFDTGRWNALSVPWVVGPKGEIASLDLGSPALSRALEAARSLKVK